MAIKEVVLINSLPSEVLQGIFRLSSDPQLDACVCRLWAANTKAVVDTELLKIGRVMPLPSRDLEKIRKAYVRAVQVHHIHFPERDFLAPLISVERYRAITSDIMRRDKATLWRALPGGAAHVDAAQIHPLAISDKELSDYLQGWIENSPAVQGLTILNLEKLGLSCLPVELWSLTALEELYLNRNLLTELPAEIGNLTALQVLFLEFNQLAQLPAEIGNLTALQVLRLGGNQLTQLPDEIRKLSRLETLMLSINPLKELPASLWTLTGLKHLSLAKNQLTEVSAGISNLAALENLICNNNQLAEIPSLSNLRNLERLLCHDNPLERLPVNLYMPHSSLYVPEPQTSEWQRDLLAWRALSWEDKFEFLELYSHRVKDLPPDSVMVHLEHFHSTFREFFDRQFSKLSLADREAIDRQAYFFTKGSDGIEPYWGMIHRYDDLAILTRAWKEVARKEEPCTLF